jgi:hypothetical protein
MSRLPTVGSDNNDWGNVLNDYLSVSLDTDGTIKDSALSLKTINSNSLIGSGDISVQPALVSGTTIKTINSTSLLGSGDIVISGASSSAITTTTFTSSILLDKLNGRDYGVNNVTTNIDIALDQTNMSDGSWAQIGLVGDGSHTPTFSAWNKFDVNGLNYDNAIDVLNVVLFFRYMSKLYWNIIDQYSITAPTLVGIGTSTNGLTVSFEFSRDMADPSSQTGLFSFSPSKTVSSVSLRSGNAKIIDVVVSVVFSIADTITSTVGSGLMPSGLGGGYAGVTNHAVTNNIAPSYVDWTNVPVQLSEGSNGAIEKISADTIWDSGAASVEAFTGNFRIETEISVSKSFMMGINTDQTVGGYTEMTHSIFWYVGGGGIRFMEGSVNKNEISGLSLGIGWKIALIRTGTIIRYEYKPSGGSWIAGYTSSTASSSTVYVGICINGINGKVINTQKIT